MFAAFSQGIANKTGMSRRTVDEFIQIGESISADQLRPLERRVPNPGQVLRMGLWRFVRRWRDIDFERGLLSIRGTVATTHAGPAIKPPKTARAERLVVLPVRTLDGLCQHRGKQAEHRLLMGSKYQNHDLVFCREDGTLHRPCNVSAAVHRLIRALGFSLSFHGLRHTHASHLLAENVHPKVVSERLGHSSIGITLDTYSHLLPSLQEEAARKIDLSLDRAARRRAVGE